MALLMSNVHAQNRIRTEALKEFLLLSFDRTFQKINLMKIKKISVWIIVQSGGQQPV